MEWTAGAALLASSTVLLFLGSRLTRFLVIWLILSFLPFALWEPQNISPRYVYMAAMPFCILVPWFCITAVTKAVALASLASPRGWIFRSGVIGTALAAAMWLTVISVRTTADRNAAWSAETAKYGILRNSLEKLPQPAHGSRLVIFYGEWTDFWATAVARTVYGDQTISAVVIPPQRVDTPLSASANDVEYLYVGQRLLPANVKR